jgi:hypothetical protein
MIPRTSVELSHIVVVGLDVDLYRRLDKLLGLCGWYVLRATHIETPFSEAALLAIDHRAPKEPLGAIIRSIKRTNEDLPIVILAGSADTRAGILGRRQALVFAPMATPTRYRYAIDVSDSNELLVSP